MNAPRMFACRDAEMMLISRAHHQLHVSIVRNVSGSAKALTQHIDQFISRCVADGLCTDIRFTGLQNWNGTDQKIQTQLYFSVLPSEFDPAQSFPLGGRDEKGKGIGASGSAAYAMIWDM